MKNIKFFNNKNAGKKKSKILFPVKVRILSGFVAAMTVASPVLSYAADISGYETTDVLPTTETEINTSSDVETDSDESTTETRFLFINMEKATGGKILINEGTDEQKALRLEKEHGIAYIDEYDKDNVLIARNEALANNYVYVYEAAADSIVNMKVLSDSGYVLSSYTISDSSHDDNDDEQKDENQMKSPSNSFIYPIMVSGDMTINVEFTEVTTTETPETSDKDLTVNGTPETETSEEPTDDVENTEDENSGSDVENTTDDLTVIDKSENESNEDLSVDVDKADPDSSDSTENETETKEEGSTAENPDADSEGDNEGEDDKQDASSSETDMDETGDAESTDEDSTEAEETEHFLETMNGVEDLNASDFTSSRLIVLADSPEAIIDPEHLVGNYGSIYLLQYKTPEQAMNAYMYYLANAQAVEPDSKVIAASEETMIGGVSAADEAKTEDDNALSILSESDTSIPAVKSSNVIALIDTGTSEGKNIVDRVSMIDDVLVGNGHGDAMAKAIVSQNSNAKILSIRALGNDGYGSYSAVVSAVEYAINSNVDIINLSMYSKKTLETSILEAEIEKAVQSGITVVGSAGNDGAEVADYIPGGIEDIYTIGAMNNAGVRRSISNYGDLVDYYVTADTTSEAAAMFSGYISANGLEAADSDTTGLIKKEASEGDYENGDVNVVDKNPETKSDMPVMFDPIIENYVRNNADNSMVGDTHSKTEEMVIMNVLDVKAIVADEKELHEGETIASLNANGGGFRFLTQQVGRVPVYDFSPNSKYFVAFADVMHNDKNATVLDVSVAENSMAGNSVTGFQYDKDTGLLYIPKKAFLDSEGAYAIGYLQTQLLYSISGYSVESQWNSATYAVTENADNTVDKEVEGDNIFLQVMNVQVGKHMDVNSMLVSVNGYPIDGHLYTYNPNTGNLVIGFSSVVVQSVWVQAQKSDNAPDVEPGMQSAETQRVGFDKMNVFSNAKLKLKSTDAFFVKGKLWAGAKAQIGYTDNSGADFVEQGYKRIFAYRGFINDIRADLPQNDSYGAVYTDYIFNTEKDDPKNIGKYTGKYSAEVINSRLTFTEFKTSPYVWIGDYQKRMYTCALNVSTIGKGQTYSMDFSNFSSKDLLIMECTHVDASALSKWKDWTNHVNMADGTFIQAKIALKLVSYNRKVAKPYAVFALYTDEMNSQHGTGLFKVYVDAPAKLTVRKWLANQSTIAQANERYSSNINSVFTVFSDKDCNSKVKEFSVASKGSDNAKATITLNPGTYYVKETRSVTGCARNEVKYGPITLLAGDDKDLSDFIPKEDRRKKYNMGDNGVVINRPYAFTGLLLKKKSSRTNEPLAGAVFRMEYSVYGTNPSAGQQFKKVRTWYFVTDKNGEIKYDKAHLTSNYNEFKNKYKSDALFLDSNGNPALPLCAIRYTEVVAPKGYVLDPITRSIWTSYKKDSKGNYITTDCQLQMTNVQTVTNDEVNEFWGLRANVRKVDGNGSPLKNAVFGIYANEQDAKNEEEEIVRLTTGADGLSQTYEMTKINENVKSVTLYCKELVAPEGYIKSDKIYSLTFNKSKFDELKKADANTPGELQTFGGSAGIPNSPASWYVSTWAKKINNLGRPLAGAKFGIYDTAECSGEPLTTIVSGADGITNTATISVGAKDSITLYCKELEAPNGYAITDEIFSQTWNKADYPAGSNTGETKQIGSIDGIVNDAGWKVNVYTKKVNKTNAPLEGAEFDVYSDSALTKKVGTLKSAANGVTNTVSMSVSSSTASVTLYCKETKAPAGCVVLPDVFSQTFTKAEYDASGKPDGVTKAFGTNGTIVNDDPWKLKFKAKKVDEKGNALSGAVFKVYTDEKCTEANCVATLASGDDGWTETITLPQGSSSESVTLYCKETEAPEGYSLSSTVQKQTWSKADYFTKLKADKNFAGEEKLFGPASGIVNTEIPDEWVIRYQAKKVADDGSPLANADFGVYTDKNCTEESQIGSLRSDDDGMTEIVNMSVDGNTDTITIYCKELAAPEGYEISNEVYALTYKKSDYEKELKNGNTEGQLQIFGGANGIVNKKIKPPTIKIHKKSSAPADILGLSGYSVENAKFLVTGDAFTGILTIGKDGNSDTIELPNTSGTYEIYERFAPAGHKVAEMQELTVDMPADAGKNFEVEFTDEPIFVEDEFKIVKSSTKNNPIKGVVFKVEFFDGNDTTKAAKRTWYLVSDDNGVVLMDDAHLSADKAFKSDAFYTYNNKIVIPVGGTLRVTEVKAPAQYVVDTTPKLFETSKNTVFSDTLGDVKNDLVPCKIRIKKLDSDGATPLQGVTFMLEYLEESEKTAASATGYAETRRLKVGESVEATTDVNGEIVWDNLDQGKYRITETSTVAGHTLLTEPIEVNVPISLTDAEAKANKADTSKGVLDKGYTENWFFYDCLYEVTNSATFKLPMTGGSDMWKYAAFGFGSLAVMGTGLILFSDSKKKKKTIMHKAKKNKK